MQQRLGLAALLMQARRRTLERRHLAVDDRQLAELEQQRDAPRVGDHRELGVPVALGDGVDLARPRQRAVGRVGVPGGAVGVWRARARGSRGSPTRRAIAIASPTSASRCAALDDQYVTAASRARSCARRAQSSGGMRSSASSTSGMRSSSSARAVARPHGDEAKARAPSSSASPTTRASSAAAAQRGAACDKPAGAHLGLAEPEQDRPAARGLARVSSSARSASSKYSIACS